MGGRVDEGGSLENYCTLAGTPGSNPGPSVWILNALMAVFCKWQLWSEFVPAEESGSLSHVFLGDEATRTRSPNSELCSDVA
jgi:hypothetical protein